MEYTSTRRPCFIEEDNGLASLADMEAGISGTGNQHNHTHHSHNQNHPFFSRTLCYSASYNISRRGSLRNLSALSPRSAGPRFYDARFEDHQPHFLEACFLCKKPLGDNKDIFMYRLATSFFLSSSYINQVSFFWEIKIRIYIFVGLLCFIFGNYDLVVFIWK